MMNVNNVSSVSAFTQKSTISKEQATVTQDTNTAKTASTIVNLQSGAQSVESKSSIKVDASNAKSMVADLAAMLSKSSGAVQSNVSAFDAAALLS